jgi:hypothetical protein
MKNIQVIDGAANCTFSIFQATDEEFALIFPAPGQDVQFAEDLQVLSSWASIDSALQRIWDRPVRKRDASGIHGTLFFELERYREIFPAMREDSVDGSAINEAQRQLFGSKT